MPLNLKLISDEIVSSVTEYVTRKIQPLIDRIASLENRAPEPGQPGPIGEPGKDGRDGLDGKDGLPGERGEPGQPGPAGKDAPAITCEDILATIALEPGLIDEAVARYLAANPPQPGKDGRDGLDGKDGLPGERGEPGQPGPAGEPGRDGRDGLPGRDGAKGEPGIDGKDGRDGKDGQDGLGFEDMSVELAEDQRTVIWRYERGENKKEFPITFSVVIDRGVWREGEYKAGDGVSWAGSFWIAQRDTAVKPETSKGDWRLAVKRGRDGKDGERGPAGPPGRIGEQGPRGFNG